MVLSGLHGALKRCPSIGAARPQVQAKRQSTICGCRISVNAECFLGVRVLLPVSYLGVVLIQEYNGFQGCKRYNRATYLANVEDVVQFHANLHAVRQC